MSSPQASEDLTGATLVGDPARDGLVDVGGASFRELVVRRELLWNLTLRELRSKYKRSVLGWVWSLLNPLSSIAIYSIVFGHLLGGVAPRGNPSQIENFALWLTCGLLPWNFLAASIGTGTGSVVGNAGLIKKVYFPREYLVASAVLSCFVSFLIEMAVLSVAFLFVGHVVIAALPGFVVLALLQLMLGLGYALFFSALNVYFRDIQHLIGILLQVWFFLTPIVYPMNTYITNKYSPSTVWIYKLNPMVHFVNAYRNLLYDGRAPGWDSIGFVVASAVIMLVIGMAVFRRLEPRMVEEL